MAERAGLNEVTGEIGMDSINPPLQIREGLDRIDKNSVPHKQIGVAVISNEAGEILIDKRKMGGAMGGLWEFPGGKIEAGETIVDCIVREIREELAIEISVGEHLITIDHTYPTIRVTLIAHHCKHTSGIPQPIESDEIRWVKIGDLHQYQFPDANEAIIRAILQGSGLSANESCSRVGTAAGVWNPPIPPYRFESFKEL